MLCECGLEFEPKTKSQKYCTPKCCDKMWARRYRASVGGTEKRRLYMRQYLRGVTNEWMQNLLEKQENRCAICRNPINLSAHLDHNHKTGQNRGFLCVDCNLGLGRFKDNIASLQRAIDYLIFYEEQKPLDEGAF